MGEDLVPRGDRIDRAALERIIHRAAELQAAEREIGEGLTDDELLRLGDEVGIPPPYLQQALLEERTRSVVVRERGVLARLAGPSRVAAQRTVAGQRSRLEQALHHWMADGELLAIRRRFPDRTTWEPRRGAFASLRRSFGAGGREYRLARAREISTEVIALDDARCHVRLVADLSNTRRERVQGGLVLAGLGAVGTGIGMVLGVMEIVAAAPAVAGALSGVAVVRGRYGEVEHVQVALEQVLDRLEHGEIQVPRGPAGPRPSAFVRIADEFRRTFGV